MKYYLHIPFCHAKCAYCDFYSMPVKGREKMQEAFVSAVAGEIDGRVGGIERFDTLYFGGGTPSSLPLRLLGRLCELFFSGVPVEEVTEFTIETNPEDVTDEYVSFLQSLPVKPRISMGIQSFDDRELSFIGRRHTSRDVEQAFHRLREGGIDNISLDLIYGLPSQDQDSWSRSLEKILGLHPEHISAYLLSYEPGTRLYSMLSAGKVDEAPDDLVEKMYDLLCRKTREAGYSHYEISNFALPGRRAIHNSSYWTFEEYIGLGPGAHSFHKGRRGYNRSTLKDYIATGGLGVYEQEDFDEMSRFNDRIITSLRTDRGLDPAMLAEFPEAQEEAERLISSGMLVRNPAGSLVIPEELWLQSDSIMRDLIRV